MRIKHDGREDTVKSASIITPIPSSSYVQSLTNDRIPLNTWVKLSFTDDDGNDAGSIKRSLHWKSNRGSNIIEDVEVLGGFGVDPIALEIGTKMPGLIPYIQLDSTSDLGNAIAELTGLHAIKDLVNHAQKSKDRLTKALPKKANTEIEKINAGYSQKRDELIDHFQSYPNISPENNIPQNTEKELLTKLDTHIDAFNDLLSKSLVKTKEILGEKFDSDDPNSRDDLTRNVSIAIDSIGSHSIKELDNAKKLRTLKDLASHIEDISSRIDDVLDEAEEINALASKPDVKSRQQLYARISGWIKENNHAFDTCPICMEPLVDKIDPVTKRNISEHIQEHLNNPKEFLRHTIEQWGAAHINDIKSTFQNITTLNELPISPHDLIRNVFEEDLFAKPCFKLSLAPLKEMTKRLTGEAIKVLPSYTGPETCKLPDSITRNCNTLLPFLTNLQKIVCFAKWRSTVDEEYKKVVEMILGKSNVLPDQVSDYSLRDCLETLQSIIVNASPIKTALDKTNKLRDMIKIDRKEQEDLLTQYEEASKAIEDILKLGSLVDKQIDSLMQQLSGKAKAWKKKLYHPAYTGHPEFADSSISANGALQIQAEVQGTQTAAQHVSNSSDLRSTLLAVYFALWEHLYEEQGGISLIILDDLDELFDQRNFRKYSNTLPQVCEVGAQLLVTTNSRQVSSFVSKAFNDSDIQLRQIHPLSENKEHIGMALLEEGIEKKRKEYERRINDDSAAKEYVEELRIYIEQQLGDILCDIKIANPLPTLSDYVDKIRKLHSLGIPPFEHDVFYALVTKTALRSNETDFMALINDSHHGRSSNIAYGSITRSIKEEIKTVLRRINEAHLAYESWVMQESESVIGEIPCRPKSSNSIVFHVPLYENIAAASSGLSGESDLSPEEFNAEILGEYAIYHLWTNNFGFAAQEGYKAIVKLADEAIKRNSFVIALHKEEVWARRYSKPLNGNQIVLNSEMLDPYRRPPALVLPVEEVRLLEVMGFLFDEMQYDKNGSDNEALLLEEYKLLETITTAFKVRGDSATPLALHNQIILGGAQIVPSDFDSRIGKLVALATNDNEQVFKRLGGCVKKKSSPHMDKKSSSHLRLFETIGGLGNSKIYRTEEMENDPFAHIPLIIPASVREIVGVLYV